CPAVGWPALVCWAWPEWRQGQHKTNTKAKNTKDRNDKAFLLLRDFAFRVFEFLFSSLSTWAIASAIGRIPSVFSFLASSFRSSAPRSQAGAGERELGSKGVSLTARS